MKTKTVLEIICGVAGGTASFLFGAADGLLHALIAFVVLDYLTGIISAVIRRELHSKTGFAGILRKILLFVLVAVANIIDSQIIGSENSVLRSAVVSFLIANEGVSILENIAEAGLPIPAKLKAVLKQLQNKADETDKTESDDKSPNG